MLFHVSNRRILYGDQLRALLCFSVCVAVLVPKGKRLELSTPRSVHISHASTTRSKGHRSRSRGRRMMRPKSSSRDCAALNSVQVRQPDDDAKVMSYVNFCRLSEYRSAAGGLLGGCLLYTSPSPRDRTRSRMPSSA